MTGAIRDGLDARIVLSGVNINKCGVSIQEIRTDKGVVMKRLSLMKSLNLMILTNITLGLLCGSFFTRISPTVHLIDACLRVS